MLCSKHVIHKLINREYLVASKDSKPDVDTFYTVLNILLALSMLSDELSGGVTINFEKLWSIRLRMG